MVEPDDLAAELPPQRSDEPASLRQDILDELQDHLQSSLQYEQISGRNEDDARESVLARFGNPATFARQLWWDAMREKIMSQRITLVLVAVLCCTSIAATVFAWKAIQQGQEVTAALVTEIKKLSDRPDPVIAPETKVDDRIKYLDWVPVKVKLVGEDGLPITNKEYEVRLDARIYTGNRPTKIIKKPDEEGKIDFGFAKPGPMKIQVTTPWKERYEESVTAPLGEPVESTIVCPAQRIPLVPTTLSVEWPNESQTSKLWTFLELRSVDRKMAGNLWSYGWGSLVYKDPISQHEMVVYPGRISPFEMMQPNPDSKEHNFSLLIDPNGAIYKSQWEIMTIQSEPDSGRGSSSRGSQSIYYPTLLYYSPDLLVHYFTGGSSGSDISSFRSDDPSYNLSLLVDNRLIDNSDRNMKNAYKQTLIATLDEPLTQIELPANGVSIMAMRIVQPLPSEDDSPPKFKTVLPVYFADNEPVLKPTVHGELNRLVYQPSKEIIELARSRLEQVKSETAKNSPEVGSLP